MHEHGSGQSCKLGDAEICKLTIIEICKVSKWANAEVSHYVWLLPLCYKYTATTKSSLLLLKVHCYCYKYTVTATKDFRRSCTCTRRLVKGDSSNSPTVEIFKGNVNTRCWSSPRRYTTRSLGGSQLVATELQISWWPLSSNQISWAAAGENIQRHQLHQVMELNTLTLVLHNGVAKSAEQLPSQLSSHQIS